MNHKKETPLHAVVKRRDIPNAKLLLEAGADPNHPYELESKATILDTVVQSWRVDYDWEVEDDEKLVATFVQCAPRLSPDCYFNILNIALERQSKEMISSFRNRLPGEDRHGWSLLSLAIQFRKNSLLDCVFLPKPSSFNPVWSTTDKGLHIVVSEDGKELCDAESAIDAESYTLSAIRTDLPIPPGKSYYYYEIEILDCGEVDSPERYATISSHIHYILPEHYLLHTP